MELLFLGIVVILIIVVCGSFTAYYDSKDKKRMDNLSKLLLYEFEVLNKEKDVYEKENFILEQELNLIKEYEKELVKEKISKDKNIELLDTFKKKKVLIGDYNKEMLKHTRTIFLSLGFDVDVVTSGEDLISKINYGYKYDVIVTNNTYMGKHNGEDVFRILKQKEDFDTPIVVLTVETGQRDFFIKELEYDEYLEKMLTQEQAIKVMTKLLLKKGI